MKHDHEKPIASKFYWEGVKKLKGLQWVDELVDDYLAFVEKTSLETLRAFYQSYQEFSTAEYDLNKIVVDIHRVYHHGADKYGDKNYLQLELSRIIEAVGRHLSGSLLGAFNDESGYPHIAHLGANILIAAELISS